MGKIKIFFLTFDLKTPVRKNHDRKLNRLLSEHNFKGKSVLNIGSGSHNPYSHYFIKAKYETLDIDPSGNPTYTMDILKEIPNKKYDFIVSFQVLEHINKTDLFFTNITKLMKKDSVFIGSVPFNYPIHSKGDYFRFTEEGLYFYLSKHFKKIKIFPYGNFVISFIRTIGSVKFLGVFFNFTSFFWDILFRFEDKKFPSGYFFICKKRK